MKRLFALVLTVVLVFTLVACGNNDADKPNDSTPSGSNTTASTEGNNDAANGSVTVDAVKNAQETDASLFEYEEVEGGVSITGFNGDDEIVAIPQSIDGKSVVEIGKSAFVNNSSVFGLKVSDTVQTIGETAFMNCSELKIFVSGNSLTSIGSRAFLNCKKLDSVELNEGLKELNQSCFSLTNLKTIAIPDSVEKIDSAFTKVFDGELVIVGASGGAAEQYVNEYGEERNIVFQAK